MTNRNRPRGRSSRHSVGEARSAPRAIIGRHSRLRTQVGGLTEWQSLMAQRWQKSRSIYSPMFFAGVMDSGLKDDEGRTIYSYQDPLSRPSTRSSLSNVVPKACEDT